MPKQANKANPQIRFNSQGRGFNLHGAALKGDNAAYLLEKEPMSIPLIRTQGLSKSYGAALPILQNLDLSISPQSYTILMGRSGAGKSTLLHVLAGLEASSGGALWYQQRDMAQANDKVWAHFRRQHIGLVFQDHNLIPYLSLLENIVLAGLLCQSNQAAVCKRAMNILEELEIAALAKRLPSEVSGGERQRAAIARALINQPQVLLADEPTGNLNEEASESVLRIFRRLHAHGQSIVMATHDLKAALEGTEVWFLRDGANLLHWQKPAADAQTQADQLYQWLQSQAW